MAMHAFFIKWSLKAIAQHSRQLQLEQACMYNAGNMCDGHTDLFVTHSAAGGIKMAVGHIFLG